MRILKGILLVAFIALIATADSSGRTGSEDVGRQKTADSPVIDYFSDNPNATNSSYIYGSVEGGTTLYIFGSGFDATASGNTLSMGDFPCAVKEGGASNTLLKCVTSKPYGNNYYNLKLNLTVGRKTISHPAYNFNYNSYYTPQIIRLEPQSPTSGQIVSFVGIHQVDQIQNINELKIGDYLCSTYNVSQGYLYSSSVSNVQCRADPLQPAGYYNISELNLRGYASINPQMKSISLAQNFTYHTTIMPLIINLSENIGSSEAHKLTINGSGFGSVKNAVDVRVAGVPCSVNSVSPNSIECTVRSGNSQGQVILPNQGRLPTDTTGTQTNGYISGTGVSFKRYGNLGGLTDKTVQGFINGVNSGLFDLLDSGVLPDFALNATNTNEAYHFKGYFKAPRTGQYTFRILTNDRVFMFVSPFKGSAEVNYSQPIISHNASSTRSGNNIFLISDYPANLTSAPISMSAGDYYYFELIYACTITGSFIRSSVEVPNNDTSVFKNTKPEIQNLTLTPTVEPEIRKFTQIGANNGSMSINISYQYPWATTPYYQKQVNITYNASADQFERTFRQLDSNSSFLPTVERQVFDINGQDPATSGLAPYKWVWTVTSWGLRSSQTNGSTTGSNSITEEITTDTNTLENIDDSNIIPTFDGVLVQPHSSPMSGYYYLSLANNYVTWYTYARNSSTQLNDTYFRIYEGTWPGSLQQYIQYSWACDQVSVINADPNNVWAPTERISLLVSLKGCAGQPADLPLMVGGNSGLEGGALGTTPAFNITELQAGSKNLLIEPISSEYLFVMSDRPQTLVTVNGVGAVCQSNCSFNFTPSVPTLTNAVLTSTNTLNLTLNYTGSSSSSFQLKDFTVSVDGVTCLSMSGSITNINCVLPKNADGSLQVRAGNFTPMAMIAKIGAAKPAATPPKIMIPLRFTNFMPTTTGFVGGISMILKGSGFPFDLSASAGLTVTMCSQPATINSINNTFINITVPECTVSATSIVVSYGAATASLAFNYDPTMVSPEISSINPNSASPVLKGSMTINGLRFGTNRSEVTVWLTNSTARVYQLNVIRINDTQLLVKLPGGLPGTFKVVVSRLGYGNSKESTAGIATFKYEIVINSVSPTVGSRSGGTILTITGRNFSPDPTDNQVFVGEAINWFCQVTTATATQLQCRTPPLNSQYTTLNQSIDVFSKLTVQATCATAGACTFTYDNSTFPTITTSATQYLSAGQAVTLSGTGLVAGGVLPTVWVGTVQATVTSASSTSVSFTYPALRAGTYPIWVYVNGVGYADPRVPSINSFSASSISPSSGSIIGNVLKIAGNALTAVDDPFFSLKITKQGQSDLLPYDVVYDTPTALGIRFMSDSLAAIYEISYMESAQWTYTASLSMTPVVTLSGSKNLTYSTAGLTLIFVRQNATLQVTGIEAFQVDSDNSRFGNNVALDILSVSTTSGNFSVNASSLTAGKWAFLVNFTNYGYAKIDDLLEITASSLSTPPALSSSYAGGNLLVVAGVGLNKNSKLRIDGQKAELVGSNLTHLTFRIPPFVGKMNRNKYNYASSKLAKGKLMADTPSKQERAMDDKSRTYYESSSSTDCWVGLDLGTNYKRALFRIRYYINKNAISPDALIGAVFEGSTDNTSYTSIAIIDGKVHRGWNEWSQKSALPVIYRYLRMRHNATSACKISELRFYDATVKDNSNAMSFKVDAQFTDGFHTTTWSQLIDYRNDSTPNVTGVNPQTASPKGGSSLTITGTGFGTNLSAIAVNVDTISCVPTFVNNTNIVCTVGAKLQITPDTSFDVWVSGKLAVVSCRNFSYAYRWSDPETWGGDFPPIEGDAVYVPQGMVLMVDQSTPKVKIIIVEGTLTFADEAEMTVQAEIIMVNYGTFQIGTEDYPYRNKLTIILYGGYYDRQIPVFGNKVIGCHACQFDIHGKPRIRTWTELSDTITAGSNTVKLMDAVDWTVGEQIVVASTSYDHLEAQRKYITAIDSTNKIITVDSPFKSRHLGVVEGLDNDTLKMRAEVGLLSRNVVIKGAEDTSGRSYGGHILMHGTADDGLQTRIEYAEIASCGQGTVLGRYCIFYQQNDDLRDCYLRGNSFHDGYMNFISIQAANNLEVSWNVGHLGYGQGLELLDGTQIGHTIENNLLLGTQRSWYMSELPSTYLIRHPSNVFRGNRAAGSEAYGIQFLLEDSTGGMDAASEICPNGNVLGELTNIVAHSNQKTGLRITTLVSRINPCQPVRQFGVEDVFALNPSLSNNISNITVYKNKDKGLLAQAISAINFTNITAADNAYVGIMILDADNSNFNVTLRNAVIVGSSANNGDNNTYMKGLSVPYSNNFKASGVTFYRFFSGSVAVGVSDNLPPLKNDYVTSFFERIRYSNMNGYYVNWYDTRAIFYDLDGTLTKPYYSNQNLPSDFSSAALIPRTEANIIPGRCFTDSNSYWGGSLLCNAYTKPRSVMLFAAQPYSVQWYPYIFTRVNQTNSQLLSSQSYISSQFSETSNRNWVTSLIPGSTYQVEMQYNVNFLNLKVMANKYVNESEPAIILRFVYTESRELYEIKRELFGVGTPLITQQTALLNAVSCIAGDYYQNHSAQYVDVCVTARQKTPSTAIDIVGVICRQYCPTPLPPNPDAETVKQPFLRIWSNKTQWPRGDLPLPGDNVTIPSEWTILMDMDPADIYAFEINGDVIVGDRDTVITAKYIWIRAGSLMAGNSTNPFGYKLDIYIDGTANDPTYVIDPNIAARTCMVVTGRLGLYSVAPTITWTRLTSGTAEGDTVINVGDVTDWAAGDEVIIAPSFSNGAQFEKATIASISGNAVTLSSPLSYPHYGDSTSITTTIGSLDMRTAVGHLTRKIRIIKGPSADNWGFRVLVYSFNDGSTSRTGRVALQGVQFIGGGQPESQYAALEFLNTAQQAKNSTAINCSFINCRGYCVKASQSSNVTIFNNVIAVGRKFMVRIDSVAYFNFSRNLIVGTMPRGNNVTTWSSETTACLLYWGSPNYGRDWISVTNNLCQGSSGNGFMLPFAPCTSTASNVDFTNNQAGSCRTGFLFNRPNNAPGNCVSAFNITAYNCEVGFLANPPSVSILKFDSFTLADNGRALGLKHGFGSLPHDNNTAWVTNSWISAVARPSCTSCYGNLTTDCTSNEGVRMMASTLYGWPLPSNFDDASFDRIDSLAALDSKAFFVNVTFDNFRQNYTGLSQCGGNYVFKPHPDAYEEIGSSHLFNTSCIGCEPTAWAYFTPPPLISQSESLGCGNFACTGRNNYIIEDHSGSFMGFNGTLIPNNSWVGGNEQNCNIAPLMNGYVCNRTDVAVLEYESVAKDYNTRIVWPIELSYSGGNWTSITNGWRNWEWSGTETKNRRLGRFVSLVVLGKVYNMSFASQPPSDMRFQLQKRNFSGDASEWIAVYIYYPIANFIAVSVNKEVIQPILATSDEPAQNRTDVCGANKFFYKNGTISFVVTGASDCQVRLSVTNNIQVTARIQTTVQEFFNNGGVTKFVDRMCAFLNITTDRLKVVGVFSGSAVVDYYIVENSLIQADTNNASNTNTTVDPSKSQAELTALSKQIADGAASNMHLDGLGAVISASTVVNIVNADGTPYVPPEVVMPDQIKSTAILLAIIFSSLIGAALLAIGLFFLIRKLKNGVRVDIKVEDERDQEKSGEIKDKELIFAEVMPNTSMDRIELQDDSPTRNSSPRKRRVKRLRQ